MLMAWEKYCVCLLIALTDNNRCLRLPAGSLLHISIIICMPSGRPFCPLRSMTIRSRHRMFKQCHSFAHSSRILTEFRKCSKRQKHDTWHNCLQLRPFGAALCGHFLSPLFPFPFSRSPTHKRGGWRRLEMQFFVIRVLFEVRSRDWLDSLTCWNMISQTTN